MRNELQGRKYQSYFLNHGRRIKSISEIPDMRWEGTELSLWCDDKYVGHGSLFTTGKNSLHTDQVWLNHKFRRKGHGIPLYLSMIAAAYRLKADRVYSGIGLNKNSRRMWSKKLPLLFDVKSKNGCKDACKHCRRRTRYYIVFKNLTDKQKELLRRW